jgi:hypothetical protein
MSNSGDARRSRAKAAIRTMPEQIITGSALAKWPAETIFAMALAKA